MADRRRARKGRPELVAESIELLALAAQRVRGPMARFEVARCRAVLAQAQGRFVDAGRLGAEALAILDPTDHDVRFTFRTALTMNVAHHAGGDNDAIASFDYSGAREGHAEMIGLTWRERWSPRVGSLMPPRCTAVSGRYGDGGPLRTWC